MAVLTVQDTAVTGLATSFPAASGGGDSFPNDGMTYLHVKNGGGAAITVTIDSQAQCSFGFDHNQEVTVDPGAEGKRIGPFKPIRWNDTNGRVNVTYSGVTSVTVAAIRLTPAPA